MKALIIGGAGFVGKYLLHHLSENYPWQLHVTKLPSEELTFDKAAVHDLNILSKEEIIALLSEIQPDYIFHLAAQSSVSVSWQRPVLTADINIIGCINLLDAVRESNLSPRILLIGSGEEYGHIRPEDTPIKEDTLPRPGNIYAVTKTCQNMIGAVYAKAYQMDVMMVRAFNHIGPEQTPVFVAADLCRQVAMIEKGQAEPVMSVGNLSAKRDFTDVKDVVRAYGLLIQKGERGETYNIGSGHAIEIRELLQKILDMSTCRITVETDPKKLRPVDVPIIEADISKVSLCTGWRPEIPIEETLYETLDYWRSRL